MSSRQWFRGVGRRISADGVVETSQAAGSGEAAGGSQVEIIEDDPQTASIGESGEVVRATLHGIENMQLVAAGWLADDTLSIDGELELSISEFMVEAAIAMTDREDLLHSYMQQLNAKWHSCKMKIMEMRSNNLEALALAKCTSMDVGSDADDEQATSVADAEKTETKKEGKVVLKNKGDSEGIAGANKKARVAPADDLEIDAARCRHRRASDATSSWQPLVGGTEISLTEYATLLADSQLDVD